MFRSIKKWLKNFFALSKNDQRGINVLLLLIIILVLVRYMLIPALPHTRNEAQDTAFLHQVQQFIRIKNKQEDSLKQVRVRKQKKKFTPFLFNPNKMTLETGLKLGLSKKQAQIIMNYLKKGGKFYRKDDFKKMYSISDSEYKILAPFIQISTKPERFKQKFQKVQINRCNEKDLINNLKLKPYMAERIIKYRTALGNFYSKEQLKEVYGLSSQTYQKISPWILCNSNYVNKIDLNSASFKKLLHHPYLNYENTLKIVKIRSRLHGYSNLNQLVTDAYIPDSVFNKIHHYLYIRPQKFQTNE